MKISLFLCTLLLSMKMFATGVTISVASDATVSNLSTAMSDAVAAGNTDIVLEFPDGYTLGSTVSGGDVTLLIPAGVTKLTFYAAPAVETMPMLCINTLTYSDGSMTGGIVFDGVKLLTGTSNRYLIQPSSANASYIPGKLTIRNCWIQGYRAIFYSTLATTTHVNFYNNYFKNITNSGIISVSSSYIPVLNIRNNTFNNVGGDASASTGTDYFIDFRSSNCVTSQINFSNNTIYYPRTQGRGLFRLGSSGIFTTGYIKENNNLYSTGNASAFTLQLLYTNTTGATSDTDSTNYYSNKMLLGSNKGVILTTVYTENDPSNLFRDPSNDDFTITDTYFEGKSVAGDPRWFFKEVLDSVRVTTTVSPVDAGSINYSSITVKTGTSVTLTATANFGYAFKEWKGAISGDVVSTSAQYNFAPTTDSALVAVFEELTTYDFTLEYNGTGAHWGNVTLTPAPTNGKYVSGTEVAATVVPNAITTFSKWDDNTTTTTKVVTVNTNMSLKATFNVIPFITGWDFKTAVPLSNRDGDYYTAETNKGLLNIYNQDGTTASWIANEGYFTPSAPCAFLGTNESLFATNRCYWQASFSTLGYENIQVKSQMAGTDQYYTTQKLQASLNGTDYTDLTTLDLSSSIWGDLNATLSSMYENQPAVYVRWIADQNSILNGNGNDGTALTNVYVYANHISTPILQSFGEDIYGYKQNDIIVLNNLPLNSHIHIYSLTGVLLIKIMNPEKSYSTQISQPCLVKVTNNQLVKVIKLL